MEYKYAKNQNYEDFASGRVLYHMGGEPTFPVRLALEIYERCRQYSAKKKDITIYDCCCGGAYMLTVLGILKADTIARIYASDIDPGSIKLANDNLGLLTDAGLKKRRNELEALYKNYGKQSHREALESLERIEKLISDNLITANITTDVFIRNATEPGKLSFVPDIIITDVPYGNMTNWNESSGGVNQLMDALFEICGQDTIICICTDKKQKIQTQRYQRLEKQLVGKRKFEIFKKLDLF